jgi:hypothetical protein
MLCRSCTVSLLEPNKGTMDTPDLAAKLQGT